MKSNQRSNRYARQIQFGPIGKDGQAGIRQANIAILGCGALGTVAAEILARAGVAKLTLLDRDVVEWSNLQRQALFNETDAENGISKAEAAAMHLCRINSDVETHPIVADISSANIGESLSTADLVIDAADNFLLRFLLNDWSLKHNKPWVHGGCVGATGQVQIFSGLGGPCFRCLVPEVPPAASVDTCDTAGVLGSATHVIASLQATEAIKWISGNQVFNRQKLLSVDLWNNRIRELKIPSQLRQSCVACGKHRLDFLEGENAVHAESSITLCGRDAVQIQTNDVNIDFTKLAHRWHSVGKVQQTRFFIRLHLNDEQSLTVFRDGRAVVNGTDQPSHARTLVNRFIGG
ncbi:ThiF family adenylyltransferase [Rubripirellula sp.]|nr:ThiF family adenylyltransferase [Rubripirellula sp.]